MKIVIVGVGGMGGCHFDIYKNMKGIEFAAACDIRIEELEKKAEGLDIKLYSDYDEMLKTEKPDIVDVCTPTYLHKEHTIKAFKAGANVICEKPMAISTVDAEEVIAASEQYGRKFMAAHVVRFMRAYKYLENVIRTEKYGKPLKLYLKRIGGTPLWSWENWMLDINKSGHVVLDLMIHDIDYAQMIFGEPDDINGVYYGLKDNSNYASANYIYKNFSVSLEASWFKADIPFTAEYLAVFEKGYVELKNGKVVDCGEEINFDNADIIKETGINISNVDGYSDEIEYFIDCVKNDLPTDKVQPQSSRNSVALAKRTLDSLKKL